MSRKMKLDFTGVESFQRAAEGEHLCKIAQVDEKTSQGGNEMIVVVFEVIKGESKTARVYENYPLIDTALWKLKGLLQAIGMKADGKVQLDLDKLVGKTCVVGVKHEEYEGKTRARVDYVNKVSVVEDDDDDDENDEDESGDETEDEPMEKPVKAKATEKKPAKKSQPEPEEDDDDDWDDDEEEEEEKPAPKKKAKKPEPKEEPKKAAKKDAKKSKATEDDDDDDWDDDDWDE